MRPAFRRPRPLRYIPPGTIQTHRERTVTKADFACCVAYRDDHGGRWAIGDCGPDCLRKEWRKKRYGSTTNPQASTDNPQADKRTMGTISPHTEET